MTKIVQFIAICEDPESEIKLKGYMKMMEQ